MKKIIKSLLSFILIALLTIAFFIRPVAVYCSEPDIKASSAILIEASTGQVIYEKNADDRLHPASITKIMTLILIFDAIKNGDITLNDTVTVSEHAASMGGSQVFLEAGEIQTVDTLIKCIAIASANDACVTMAEYIAGSEEVFVERMNERAIGLGMNSTHFINCCGLDADGHMTTARDVAIMSRELINSYPEIHNYSTIWMDTIIHSTKRGDKEFTLTNTNKLLKQYEWATGLKTGSTSLAKFCLSATADRNGIELISVVMASPDGKARVNDSIALLNYGYGICTLFKDNNEDMPEPVQIKNGTQDFIDCHYDHRFSYLFTENFDASLIASELNYLPDLSAPISKNQTIGEKIYKYDGRIIGSVEIKASEAVEKAGYSDFLKMLFDEYIL